MNDDELERLLSDSFDRAARGSAPDRGAPPRPRFLDADEPAPRHRARILAPLAAAAAVVALVVGVLAVTRSDDGRTVANPPGPSPTAAASTGLSTVTTPRTAVHVSLLNQPNATVGVGMPVIARFTQRFTDASQLARATRVTVNGKPVTAAWYFERSAAKGQPVEGHLRMASYWPADAEIHVDLPIKGLSAGTKYAFDDSLSLDFSTGDAQIATVNDHTHQLTLTRNGKPAGVYPVSLGAAATPTTRGTKVIMDKGADIAMTGPGYYDPHVRFTQRLTYSGEYLHAAPWNSDNIVHGIDSSNGCTNLETGAAKTLYGELRVGDVVRYPNASGAPMTMGEGYGDWNVPWSQWLTGGAVPTS